MATADEPRVTRFEGLAMPDPVPAHAGRVGAVGYLLDAMRLRPWGRRTMAVLSVVMAAAGVAMVAYPLATDVYANEVLQSRLNSRYESAEAQQRYEAREVRVGDPLTRLTIPSLGVRTVVVEGTSPAALRAGAGHYPNTPLPGEQGNVGIAGHRTTYGRPFNRLDELAVGQRIVLETPVGTYVYKVAPHPPDTPNPCANDACWVTTPDDWSVVAPTRRPSLTLTTCHPKGSAQQRLIVRAVLVERRDARAAG